MELVYKINSIKDCEVVIEKDCVIVYFSDKYKELTPVLDIGLLQATYEGCLKFIK